VLGFSVERKCNNKSAISATSMNSRSKSTVREINVTLACSRNANCWHRCVRVANKKVPREKSGDRSQGRAARCRVHRLRSTSAYNRTRSRYFSREIRMRLFSPTNPSSANQIVALVISFSREIESGRARPSERKRSILGERLVAISAAS